MQGEVKENIDKKSVNDHRVEVDKIFGQSDVSKWFEPSQVNPYVLNAPYKGYIRKKWVNMTTSRFIVTKYLVKNAVNLKKTHNCSKCYLWTSL